MSDIQVGDVVVCVDRTKCLYGRDVHEGMEPDGADLTGTVHRVSTFERDEETGLGGWFIFTDGEAWCDGCCHKLNDEPDDAKLIARIRKCRPICTPEPTHA